MTLSHHTVRQDQFAELSRFRGEFHSCPTRRADALFELADAVLRADGPVRSLVELSLVGEHRRGHGGLYDALSAGRVDVARLRRALATVPLPRAADGRLVLAADLTCRLRPSAHTSPQRISCAKRGAPRVRPSDPVSGTQRRSDRLVFQGTLVLPHPGSTRCSWPSSVARAPSPSPGWQRKRMKGQVASGVPACDDALTGHGRRAATWPCRRASPFGDRRQGPSRYRRGQEWDSRWARMRSAYRMPLVLMVRAWVA